MLSVGSATVTGFLLSVLCGEASGELDSVNLLSNGGFEEGVAGWSPAAEHSLVRGISAAHSGQACLTGEVTKPNQALFLRRRVRVKANRQYRFEIKGKRTGVIQNHASLIPRGGVWGGERLVTGQR